MRKVLFMFFAITLLAASCSGCDSEAQQPAVDTVPEMVMQIKKCSRLYTTECNIHKLVTHGDKLNMKGRLLFNDFDVDLPFGERKIAIPMNATAKAYIDMSNFSADNIHRHGDKVEIILPDPRITLTSTRIDHEKVNSYVPLLRKSFSDEELTSYAQQGRKAIIEEIPNLGLIEIAQENAAHILVPIIAQLGFEEQNITITFRKTFTPSDITSFIIENKTNNEQEN